MSDKIRGSRLGRTAKLAKLGAKVGGTYASTAARKAFASAERREELNRTRELRSAEAVAAELGQMKGALMKLGQMASYLDGGMPEPVRQALAQLQQAAPPMSVELATSVVTQELGAAPNDIFVEWDPEPIAAASIGQVHRALLRDADGIDHAVAVKLQYPGVGDAIEADLSNTALIGTLMKQQFSGFEPDEMVDELRLRLTEELDYEHEARNQQLFLDYYEGHPFFSIPNVFGDYSTKRVLTTELVEGVSWSEMTTWSQEQKNLTAEAIFRFVFRSLYNMHAFNGDPHPGNYLLRPDGQVVFLDFGLVKHFSDAEMDTFERMVRSAAVDGDWAEFRSIIVEAGMLQPDAPVTTEQIGEYYGDFYRVVHDGGDFTWTPEYASHMVRHLFDRNSAIAQYSTVPRTFVFIQRINLGLYALLGELHATANWRQISEELWPFANGEPSTPMGELEAEWMSRYHPGESHDSGESP